MSEQISAGGEQLESGQVIDDYLPEHVEWKPGDPEEELSRVAAQITLARVDKWKNLNAPTLKERDRIFGQKTTEAWRKLVTHGVMGVDRETGKPTLLNFTDLDGKCALGLVELAFTKNDAQKRRDFRKNVQIEYVHPSEFRQGRINLDISDRHGIILEDGGMTVFVDHHGEENGEQITSATELTYKALDSLGMFDDLNRDPKINTL